MPFQPYDPRGETVITRQNLPHWQQAGVTYFVTSRLADSLPQSLLTAWRRDRDAWLRTRGLVRVEDLGALEYRQRQEYQRKFTARWHRYLDAGYGRCWLDRSQIALLLKAVMVAGHGVDYQLDAWVIMPNHYHALVTPSRHGGLSRILQRWKGASAREINAVLKRSGTLWRKEGFDHIVRDRRALERFRRYVALNPVRAGLVEGRFLVGFRGDVVGVGGGLALVGCD